jgi:putative membrane protein
MIVQLLWVKAFHIMAMVAWFAGIFYLPRLFVYHAMCAPEDEVGRQRFHVMERKLLRGIMNPSAVLTLSLGFWLIALSGGFSFLRHNAWLHAKLALVALLLVYHGACWKWMIDFREGRNRRGHRFYRVVNEIPVLLLAGIVILVVIKPF